MEEDDQIGDVKTRSSSKVRFFEEDIMSASNDASAHDVLFVAEEEEEKPQWRYETPADKVPDTSEGDNHLEYDDFERQLTSIVGPLPRSKLEYLHKKYHGMPNNLELAIDYLFESSNRENVSSPSIISDESQTNSTSSQKGPLSKKRSHHSASKPFSFGVGNAAKKAKAQWNKFIGTINAQAWATRSTSKPLEYGSLLYIKRHIPKSSRGSNKFGSSAVIRLVSYDKNERETEIGRVPEDVGKILSPLIDLGLLKVDIRVILCEMRLSTGDSFFIQIDCFLTSEAFEDLGLSSSKEITQNQLKVSTHGRKFVFNETEDETRLRFRQASVVKLFDRLFLKPTKSVKSRSNEGEMSEDGNDVIIIDDDEPNDKPIDQLNINQLKEFYKTNQEGDMLESLPESKEPPDFTYSLRNYQKQGLSWMLTREKEKLTIETSSLSQSSDDIQLSQNRSLIPEEEEEGMMNPLWREYRWPRDTSFEFQEQKSISLNSESTSTVKAEHFYANIYSGEFSKEKPVIKSMCRGGILADEMGLGKTVSTLSLIHSVVSDKSYDSKKAISESYAFKTTLVVVPMSLLSQWQKEFESSNSNPGNKCYVYYGTDIVGDMTALLCTEKAPIVVFTTYGTILNEWTKISNTKNAEIPRIGLFSVKFFRIVLDEGHIIRNRITKTTKAIYNLRSSRKWVLTGTPIINRLDDLFSLIRFLELEPWCNFSYWKTFVTLPFEKKLISQTLDVIKSIMEPIVLRRTKNMKQKDGRNLVELPSKEIVVEEIKFNDKERKLYDWFLHRAESSFKESLKAGNVLKKYSTILTHILRLRQVCCHMDLVGSANEMEDDFVHQANQSVDVPSFSISADLPDENEISSMKEAIYPKLNYENTECSICTTSPVDMEDAGVIECGHLFCINCIMEHLDYQEKMQAKPLCPNCRRSISKYRLFKIRNKNEYRMSLLSQGSDPVKERPYSLYYYDPNQQSSKIKALITHLKALKDQNTNEHVVVFSQFSAYLDIIEKELQDLSNKSDFTVYKFDGRLSMPERQKILEKFAANDSSVSEKVTILLLSLKAGGVGLNLTSASTAFMMDPYWAPSIEDQAIDRIHRIGQQRNVKVTRFIMENSIEQKMLKIQERKKQIGEIVGTEEEERRKSRIEEIQMLFQD